MDENGSFFEPTGFVPRTEHKLQSNGEQILFILRVQNYWVFDFALNCITSGQPTYSPLYNYVAILHGGNKLFSVPVCAFMKSYFLPVQHLWEPTCFFHAGDVIPCLLLSMNFLNGHCSIATKSHSLQQK